MIATRQFGCLAPSVVEKHCVSCARDVGLIAKKVRAGRICCCLRSTASCPCSLGILWKGYLMLMTNVVQEIEWEANGLLYNINGLQWNQENESDSKEGEA